ncbi:protein spinster isoform X2 [Adelges cooleyi]|uniref:protein spinster isoform X2 n=1 Tax=Adelges cooleyi TaxID=133065 RepID=UPI0021802F48|nr:protein spinster isoform X2 [Adelges cooleyi]
MPAQAISHGNNKTVLQIMNAEPSAPNNPNNSQQHLMNDEANSRTITGKQKITVIILCFVNLINYMDRYTIAGILSDIQKYFNIGDDQGGLLQTVFVISYMIFAPAFGYLGDRYNRRLLMAFGVFLWSITTLVGSYMDGYYQFLFFRSLVGIGEASYSTIAPTIISDMFVKDLRSKMLALFYFAIPVGSGLGYIIGSETAKALGSWHWGLRVTPLLGMIAVVMILFAMEEPERGQSEGYAHTTSTTSWSEDIKLLTKNKSFMLSTCGFTCVAFVTGSLAWWGPTIMFLGLKLQSGHNEVDLNSVSLKFGIIAMLAGLIGVPLGSYLSQRLKVSYPKADPLICAGGLLVSAPLLFLGLALADRYYLPVLFLIFFGQVSINLNWSIVADILLYVVSPIRRSTAEAFQILISHAFGDAGSPYLIGVISEMLKKLLTKGAIPVVLSSVVLVSNNLNDNKTLEDDRIVFRSLQYALFITSFIEILGGLFFFFTAYYVIEDKELAESETPENTQNIVSRHIYTAADETTLHGHSNPHFVA